MHASLHKFSGALASFYARVTQTRYAAIFFFLAVLHFAVLVLLQGLAFAANVQTSFFFGDIAITAGALNNELPFMYRGTLKICTGLPQGDQGGYMCHTVWPVDAAQAGSSFNVTGFESITLRRRAGVAGPPEASDTNSTIQLSSQCTDVLQYPQQVLFGASRANIAFIAFDCWIFAASILALLSDSIPHLILSLASLALSTAYSMWNILDGRCLQENVAMMLAGPRGVCGDVGANLVPGFWRLRMGLDIAVAVFNLLCLLVGGFAGWRLIQRYSQQTFQSVGASPRMHRLHTVLLGFTTLLRLYMFFAILSTSLWIDLMRTSFLREFVVRGTRISYFAGGGAVLLLLAPWALIGERAMRRESRPLAIVFAVGGALLLFYHATLFASSAAYRLMAYLWPFFTIVAVTSCVLVVAVVVLGACCRHNFDAGLAHYLGVMRALEADGFTRAYMPAVEEKPAPECQGHSKCDTTAIVSFDDVPDLLKYQL